MYYVTNLALDNPPKYLFNLLLKSFFLITKQCLF